MGQGTTGTSSETGLATITDAPPAFHLLAKPTGAVCNLDCSYCFFLSKEMLYPGSRFRMADELLETYLRQLIEAHAARARGDDRLAGRRADADGARLLPPLGRARRALPAAGPARRVHDPDERHAARRRVGRVLRRARLPGRDLDRRPARDPRRLPREQGRQGHVRPGHARARGTCARRRRVERADHDPRRQRRPRARGVPLPARRVRRPLRPVHPDRRARDGGRRGRHGAVELVARPAALRAGRRSRDRPLGHAPSSTAAS